MAAGYARLARKGRVRIRSPTRSRNLFSCRRRITWYCAGLETSRSKDEKDRKRSFGEPVPERESQFKSGRRRPRDDGAQAYKSMICFVWATAFLIMACHRAAASVCQKPSVSEHVTNAAAFETALDCAVNRQDSWASAFYSPSCIHPSIPSLSFRSSAFIMRSCNLFQSILLWSSGWDLYLLSHSSNSMSWS